MNRRHLLALAGAVAASRDVAMRAQASVDTNLKELLSQDLWSERDGYDACHYLMIPMHAVFRNPERSAEAELFVAYMERFTNAWAGGTFADAGFLNRLQYLALVGRYLRVGPMNEQLLDLMVKEHQLLYRETIYPHWSQGDFASVRDSIEWKLANPDPERAYYTAIVDAERFGLMIGADLQAVIGSGAPDHLHEARALGMEVLRQRSTWGEKGEWMFDVGSFWDHPDQAYAGHLEATENMEPKPVPGLSWDSSHSHRLPAMLDAFLPGDDDPEIRDEVQRMRDGLARQLVDHCLVQPDDEFRSIRLTNYMDGHNGLYRWNYPTQGEGNGYRAYELSGTFLLGWWSLLGNDDIRTAYQLVADCYPLAQEEIDLYVGPNTTRERNPLFTLPDAYLPGGMMETCVKSALLL